MPVLDRPYTNFPQEKIDEVRRLARQGFSSREICRRVGTHHHNVRSIIAEVEAAGELPANCPCGRPRGSHHGSNTCPLSTGKPRKYPKVRVSRVPKEKLNEVFRRLQAGESQRRISLEVGVSITAVRFHQKRWISRGDLRVGKCRCGKPGGHPGGCVKNSPGVLSRDRRERIQQWAREGVSAAEMQRRSRSVTEGAGLATILKYARPVWDQMAAEGIVCDCGQPLGHRAACSATWDSPGRVRGPQPMPVHEARRISNALLNGDSILTIRRSVDVSEKKVLRVLRSLSAEDRHQRAVLVYRRVREGGERRHGEDLFDRIKAALPRGLEDSLRDEVVAELSLAVLQGDLTLDQIASRASRFIDRAYRDWADAFGPRSLNESLGDDSDAELLDLFGDDTAALALDELEIGQPPP